MRDKQRIVNYFVEHGLDPSYMSYDEIAEAALQGIDTSTSDD